MINQVILRINPVFLGHIKSYLKKKIDTFGTNTVIFMTNSVIIRTNSRNSQDKCGRIKAHTVIF